MKRMIVIGSPGAGKSTFAGGLRDETGLELTDNVDRLHTTEMGAERIRRNLGLADTDVVKWCRSRILDQNAAIERQGKNWYVRIDGCVITVNASSCTIITAHREK